MRLKFLFSIFSLITYAITFSQNKEHRFKIGINFSPDYCYRTLKIDSTADYLDDLKQSRDNNEIPKLSFTAGVNLLYQTNKHFSFEGGIQYSNKGYAYQAILTTLNNPDGAGDLILNYNYKYLDIPLRTIYSFGNKKLKLISSIGLTPSFNLGRKQVYNFENQTHKSELTSYDYKFNNFNLFSTVSAGIDYTFNDNFSLKVEPTFRYGILKIIDAPLTGYLWNVGLNTSLYYRL